MPTRAKQSHDEFQNDNAELELNYRSQVGQQRAIVKELSARQQEVAQLAARIERLKIAADSGDVSEIEGVLWALEQQGVIAKAARGREANNQQLEEAQLSLNELIDERQATGLEVKLTPLQDRLSQAFPSQSAVGCQA